MFDLINLILCNLKACFRNLNGNDQFFLFADLPLDMLQQKFRLFMEIFPHKCIAFGRSNITVYQNDRYAFFVGFVNQSCIHNSLCYDSIRMLQDPYIHLFFHGGSIDHIRSSAFTFYAKIFAGCKKSFICLFPNIIFH